jgi:O-antigen/teichoic acid export membrane protein
MLKKLASQTAVYGLSSILGRFLNYLLVPIHTRVFVGDAGVAEYGVQGWFYAVAGFMGVVYTYGMETTFFRFAQRADTTKENVFSTTAWSLLVSSLILSGSIILFATPLANATENVGRESYFIVFALIFATDAITTIPFAWLRQENQARRFATLRLLSIGINIGLNVFFYIIVPFLNSKGLLQPLDTEGVSIRWIFIANLLGNLAVVPFFLKEYQLLRNGFDTAMWRRMMTYALPVLVMGLAGMINEMLSRVMLKWLITDPSVAEYQNGIFSAVYKLSIIITLFIQAFRFSAEPFFFAQAKAEGTDSRQVYARVMQYFMLVCATIFIGVLLFLPIVQGFIGESYHEGLVVVPILLMANVFLGAYYNLSIWYKLTDRTMLGAVVSLAGAVLTILLNLWWIPTQGYVGAAWSTLICYFSMAMISYILGQKYFPVPYPMRRIVSFLAAALGIYFVSEMLRETFDLGTIGRLAVNTLLFGVYCWLIIRIENKAFRQVWALPMVQKIVKKVGF